MELWRREHDSSRFRENAGGGGAGRVASAGVFRGPKGAAGVPGIPADASQQLISFALCCSLAKLREIKDFLLTARRKDTKSVKIKKNKDNVKSLKFDAADTFTP